MNLLSERKENLIIGDKIVLYIKRISKIDLVLPLISAEK